MAMKLSDDARQAIHDWRWGPYIHDPIERQDADDMVIKKVMDTFNQLEEENEILQRYSEFVYEKDYGAEFDGWLALLGETA